MANKKQGTDERAALRRDLAAAVEANEVAWAALQARDAKIAELVQQAEDLTVEKLQLEAQHDDYVAKVRDGCQQSVILSLVIERQEMQAQISDGLARLNRLNSRLRALDVDLTKL